MSDTMQNWDLRPHKQIVQFILTSNLGDIRRLVEWMSRGLRKFEHIDVYHWTDRKWYIEITDDRIKQRSGSTVAMRVGFTVHLGDDKIIWNHEGGNCWVRDRHWVQWFKQHFPDTALEDANIHVYKPTPYTLRKSA